MSSKSPSLFISYCWETKKTADKIAHDFEIIGVSIIKDNQELRYTDSLTSFMKRIRSCDYALLLISDSYLKSKNCLYEILELQKDEHCWDKVLPVVFKDTDIYTPLQRITYIKYWEQKAKELESALEGVAPINAQESYKELKLFNDIAYNIDSLLKQVADSLHFSPEELFEKNYQPIIDKINIDVDIEPLTALLGIHLISNLEHREIALDNYINRYKPNAFYFSIKGSTARDLQKFDQAIYFYKKGLEVDPENFTILNNYGQIAEHVKRNYTLGKELYERAVHSNPTSDIVRLNLGVLLSRRFSDAQGAKEQYEKILEFDPNNAKAHNNLANYYKMIDEKDNLEKAEYHYLKALEIDPQYMEALIGYGNFLKVYKKELEKGNQLYMRVKELDIEGKLAPLLDTLLKSTKG